MVFGVCGVYNVLYGVTRGHCNIFNTWLSSTTSFSIHGQYVVELCNSNFRFSGVPQLHFPYQNLLGDLLKEYIYLPFLGFWGQPREGVELPLETASIFDFLTKNVCSDP